MKYCIIYVRGVPKPRGYWIVTNDPGLRRISSSSAACENVNNSYRNRLLFPKQVRRSVRKSRQLLKRRWVAIACILFHYRMGYGWSFCPSICMFHTHHDTYIAKLGHFLLCNTRRKQYSFSFYSRMQCCIWLWCHVFIVIHMNVYAQNWTARLFGLAPCIIQLANFPTSIISRVKTLQQTCNVVIMSQYFGRY